MKAKCIYITLLLLMFLASCSVKSNKGELPPWGDSANDSTALSLSDIIANGELIAATLSGPDTYYEYRGERLGLYYLLCDRFAAEVGVTLRIHLCRDSAELRTALLHGDADIVITPLPRNDESLHYCGAVDEESDCQWAVSPQGEDLAAALDQWYSREGRALQAKGPMALRIAFKSLCSANADGTTHTAYSHSAHASRRLVALGRLVQETCIYGRSRLAFARCTMPSGVGFQPNGLFLGGCLWLDAVDAANGSIAGSAS